MSSYELPSPASAGVESSFDAMLRRAVAEDVEVLQELYQEYRHDLGTTDYVEIEVLPIYDQLRTIVEQLWPMIDLGDPLDLAFLLPYPDMEVHADIIETHFEQLAAITSNPEHLAGFHAAVMGRLDRDHTDLRVMEQLNAFVMLQRVVADVAACAELQSWGMAPIDNSITEVYNAKSIAACSPIPCVGVETYTHSIYNLRAHSSAG